MKRNLRIGTILVFSLSIAASAAYAQSVWTSKPFTQWSRSDAETVLNDSPWSSNQEVRMQFEKEKQTAAGSYSGVSSASAASSQTEVMSDLPVDFIFTLRLRSALPVRQALVRLKQLESDSRKLSKKDLETFDTQIKGLLDCPACAGNYVITLSSKSRNRPGADAVYATFKGGRLSDLQRFVFLANERGERRDLVHFVAPKTPGDDAIFFFPRMDAKGAPLLTPESKQLLINLSDKQVNSVSNFRIDVSRLVMNGKVEF
ncbi:MAG: hypothetical protein QOI77_3675 [Blastocatellia bacterium]|nr:hypothetical protein [Blastocatellia bacterium]